MQSLSVLIPAYNESENIQAAYESTLRALTAAGITDYELIIITNNRPDGTNDGTPAIADELARQDSHIVRIHNPYVGLGYKFRQGVKAATKDFVTFVPGDNETVEESVTSIFRHLGQAEMVITYTGNKEVRPLKRRFVSWCFTQLCNLLFGLRLKYFNGICIYPRKMLQMVPMTADNFAYMAEIIVYLVKSGVRYIEIPQLIKLTQTSSAFRLKSVFEALGTLARLAWEIHVQRRRVSIRSV
jgi:dolichol-phosphate mannosyltransferase